MSEFSLFGQKFAGDAGILELMDDLGRALEAPGKKIMLGGGNPASIGAVNALWRRRLGEILAADGELEAMVAQYDAPGGRAAFKTAVADFLRRNYGWDVGPDHIAITGGSQSGCFLLFNLLSGDFGRGRRRRIFFPLAPEYIGYADQGLTSGQFASRRPRIEERGEHEFKYHVDFEGLVLGDSVGAVCAGRPTNPTGNVLSDTEVSHLAALARQANVPFILDNAYGTPFPSIVFEPVTPYWDSNTIVSMSLSKLGLPSVRTGIVVAPEPIARALGSANAILNLTNAGLGQALVRPLLDDNTLLELASQIIQPFYRARLNFALHQAELAFGGRVPYRIHRPQGSIFLWFWFPTLTVGSRELYLRLKAKGVLVVPGDAFFFGLGPEDDDWSHRRQCIRVNYARDEDEVAEGLRIIAETVEEATCP